MKTATTKKERMYEQIRQHGENLNAIFNTGLEPVTLCKKLLRLENKAHQLATDYCNGENDIDSENWDEKCLPILNAVYKILGFNNQIFINGDARGYALKINDAYMRENNLKLYQDWGGYGILAPQFEGK